MLLRLLAFFFFVLALGAIGGDAWASFTSGLPFSLRSLETWWMHVSPSMLDAAKRSWPGINTILPFPAPAILAVLGVLMLLPTIFLRQRH
jgi:hypothetical protein